MICPYCGRDSEVKTSELRYTAFHAHEQNIQELGQRVNSLETQLMAQFEINQRLVRDVDKLEILVQGLYTHLRST